VVSVVEVGEGAIDWLLGGLPGPAVPYGRETSVPGLCQAELILLEVYSDNCPACHRLKPALSQAAAAFQDRSSVLFVAVDGPANPAFLERLDVQWYPTLKLIHRKRNMLWDWPVIPRGGLTAADIVAVVEKYLDTPSFPPGVEAAGVPLEQTGEGGGEDGGEGKGEDAQMGGAEGGNESNGPIHVASDGPHKEMSDVEGGGGGHTAPLFSRSARRKVGNEEEDESQRGSRGKERGERIAEDPCTSSSVPPDRNPPPPAQGQAPHDEHQDPPAHDLEEGRLAQDQLAVKRTQLLKSLAEGPPSEPPPSFSQLSQFRRARRCPRDLVSRRRWVSAREIFKALGCHDEASCRALSRSQRQDREEPPHLILLGGGMGAGKTTLKKMVSQSDFWRRHGQNVVSVEADHFKEIDPVYQLLTRLNQPKASEAVHTYSTQAAEELFLSALKFKRDIIFDSTLGKKYRTEERRMAKAG
jgi:thiol-disulfide isomerase/thioredoxin